MSLNAFIIRPFGMKSGVDFDKVEAELIQPALLQAGISGSTTGTIVEAGNIREDMFGKLLTADVVIADISIHNANVFYELGIRHALRDKRTFLLHCSKDDVPFDLKTDRYLSYPAGNPGNCINTLVAGLRETVLADHKDSPVFAMLPKLEPQDAETFLFLPADFTEEFEVAASCRQEGKLALLAAEVDSFAWRIPALRLIGEAQYNMQSYEAARLTWNKIKEYKSDDLIANDRLATIYQRLAEDIMNTRYNEAMELLAMSDACVKKLLSNYQWLNKNKRAEGQALKARNHKSRWISNWKKNNEADYLENALQSVFLIEAYNSYELAYGEDLNHYYSGLNALAMLTIILSLARQLPATWELMWDSKEEAMGKLVLYEERKTQLTVLVKAALMAEEKRLAAEGTNDAWLVISKADYAFLTSNNPKRVEKLYREAIQQTSDFNFESGRRQLTIFKTLNVLQANAEAALQAFADTPTAQKNNIHYLLFTGHMIDKPNRQEPRFPPQRETEIRSKIKEAIQNETTGLDKKNIIGIAGGACGSDILFHEVCREMDIKSNLYLAVPAERFVMESVAFAGSDWVDRFYNLYNVLDRYVLSRTKELPDWLKKKAGYTIWERNNLWMLYNSLINGGANLSLIAVWNGKGGDGTGGTEHMIREAGSFGAQVNITGI